MGQKLAIRGPSLSEQGCSEPSWSISCPQFIDIESSIESIPAFGVILRARKHTVPQAHIVESKRGSVAVPGVQGWWVKPPDSFTQFYPV